MQCTLTIRFKVVKGLAAWPMVHCFSTREQDNGVKEPVDGVARLVDGEHNSSPSVGQSVGRERVNNTASRWTAVKLASAEHTSFSIIINYPRTPFFPSLCWHCLKLKEELFLLSLIHI